MRLTVLLAAFLLAGCAGKETGSSLHMDATDHTFLKLVRTNTQSFGGMSDRDIASAGRDVCRALASGGTVRDSAASELAGVPSRQARRFAKAAVAMYCPRYRKP